MAGLPISIGSVGVRIVPDMRGFVEEISAFSKTIPDINLGVNLDDAAASLRLTELQAQVDHLSGDHVEIKVDVDHAAFADGQLALFDLGEGASAAAGAVGDLTMGVDDVLAATDGASGGIGGFSRWLGGLSDSAGSAGASIGSAASEVSLLQVAVLGLIVLAGPLTAVLIPALAGVASATLSVGAAFGVLMLALPPLMGAVKAFRTEQLDPTTAHMQALQRAMVGLPGPARGMVAFIAGQLYPAFERLQHAAERGLFPGLLAGLKAAMPLITPLSRFVGILARTMGNLAAEAGRALNDKFWRRFFAFVSATAGPTLTTFAKIIGNVAQGFARFLEALGPLTAKIGEGLLGLARAFAQWTKTQSFQNFIDYLTKNAPIVAAFLGELVVFAVKLLAAFAPLGPVILQILTPLLAFLASLSPTELLAITAAIGLMVGGFGGVAVAVAAAATLIISHWSQIKGFFEAIGHWFTGPFVGFFTGMYDRMASIIMRLHEDWVSGASRIKGFFESIGHWFTGPFVGFFTSMGAKVKDAFTKIVAFIKSIPGRIEGFFKDAGTWLLKAGEAIIGGLWDGLKHKWHDVTGWLSGLGHEITSLKGPLDYDKVMLYPAGQAIIDGLGRGMKDKWPTVQDVLTSAGAAIPTSIATAVTKATPVLTASMKNLEAALQKELSNLTSQLSTLQSAEKSLASGITGSLGGFDLSKAGVTKTSGAGGGPASEIYTGGGISSFAPGSIVPQSLFDTSGAGGSSQTVFTAGGIQRYLDRYASQEQRVIELVNRLHHRGVPLSLLTSLEQEPADQALPILQALQSAGQGQLGNIIGDISSINAAASQAGRSQAQEVYDPQIKELKAEIRGVRNEIIDLKKHIGPDVAQALTTATSHGVRTGSAKATR